MSALNQVEFRIPDRWDAVWFREFVGGVLAKADIRNAVGVGVEIASDGNSVATLTVDPSTNIASHNADPFAHSNVVSAHEANMAAHGWRFRETELYAYFVES